MVRRTHAFRYPPLGQGDAPGKEARDLVAKSRQVDHDRVRAPAAAIMTAYDNMRLYTSEDHESQDHLARLLQAVRVTEVNHLISKQMA